MPYPRLVMVTQLHFNAAGNLMGFDYMLLTSSLSLSKVSIMYYAHS